MPFYPSYTFLSESEWNDKIVAADALAASCRLCPRACQTNRFSDKRGFCTAPAGLVISSVFPHHGEEPPISGTGGSGTLFFSHCTLKCLFCQNHQISHDGEGQLYTNVELADKLVWLQKQGCHNINLVTASHFLPWVIGGLQIAAQNGLSIPVVYNCGGYESPEALEILSGIVDIYLPDAKYSDNSLANKYSGADDYVEVNQAAIRQMFKQVGPLKVDDSGIARRGLCIRHLVLPGCTQNSLAVCEFLKKTFDPADITISLMAQYRPLYQAVEIPEINRMITNDEYAEVYEAFTQAGFDGFFQEPSELDESFCIDFTKRKSERLI